MPTLKMWSLIFCVLLLILAKGKSHCDDQYPRQKIAYIYALENELFEECLGSPGGVKVNSEIHIADFPDLDDVSPTFNSIHRLAVTIKSKNSEIFRLLGDNINKKINPVYRKFLDSMRNSSAEQNRCEKIQDVVEFMKSSDQVSNISFTETQLFNVSESFHKALLDIVNATEVLLGRNTQSIQALVFHVYQIVVRAYARVGILFRYTDNPRKLMTRDDNMEVVDLDIGEFRKSAQEILRQLATFARVVRRIDPEKYERNKNFIEMELGLQYDLNKTNILENKTCGFECSEFRQEFRHMHCLSTDIACPLAENMLRSLNPNVYDKIKKKEKITPLEIFTTAVKRLLGLAVQTATMTYNAATCVACQCHCLPRIEDHKDSIQAISFRPQYSDISRNRVVTGVKFLVQGNMLHIQIKEGTLLPFGRINSTQTWTPIDEVEWMIKQKEGNFYIKQFRLAEHFDYHILSQKSGANSVISLIPSELPKGYVITGVRFNYETNSYDTEENYPIGIEVQAMPFDFATGKLNIGEKDIWSNSRFSSKEYQSVRSTGFTRTSLRYANFARITRDNNKTTIPYFDVQPVTTSVEYALNGIGVFLKLVRGKEYLAMAITAINYNDYIENSPLYYN